MNTRVHFLFCSVVLVAVIFTNGIVSGGERMQPFRSLRKRELESRIPGVGFANDKIDACAWPSSLSTGAKCKAEEQFRKPTGKRLHQEPSDITVESVLQESRKFCHPSAECESGVCECKYDTPDKYGDCKTHKSRTDVDCKLEAELLRATTVNVKMYFKMQTCMARKTAGEGEKCEADVYVHIHKKYGTTTREAADEKMTPDDWIGWWSNWCYGTASNQECISGKCDCSVVPTNRGCKIHKRSLAAVNCRKEAEDLVQSVASQIKALAEFNRAELAKRSIKPTTKPPATSTAAGRAHTTTPVLFLFWILMSRAWAQTTSPLLINNNFNL